MRREVIYSLCSRPRRVLDDVSTTLLLTTAFRSVEILQCASCVLVLGTKLATALAPGPLRVPYQRRCGIRTVRRLCGDTKEKRGGPLTPMEFPPGDIDLRPRTVFSAAARTQAIRAEERVLELQTLVAVQSDARVLLSCATVLRGCSTPTWHLVA